MWLPWTRNKKPCNAGLGSCLPRNRSSTFILTKETFGAAKSCCRAIDGKILKADAHRAWRPDDLGVAPETRVQHSPRDLLGLWRGGADHRLHRGSQSDRADPYPPRCEGRGASSVPAATVSRATPNAAVRAGLPNDDPHGCGASGEVSVAAGQRAGATGETAQVDPCSGRFERRNAGQRHLADRIDERPVAPTNAKTGFGRWKRRFILLVP